MNDAIPSKSRMVLPMDSRCCVFFLFFEVSDVIGGWNVRNASFDHRRNGRSMQSCGYKIPRYVR